MTALHLDTTYVIYTGIMSNYMHNLGWTMGLKVFEVIWHLLMNAFLMVTHLCTLYTYTYKGHI